MNSNRAPFIDFASTLIRDAGGKLVGRTRLQKIAYLLNVTGFDAGLTFEYRHYGPYSEQLASALADAKAMGLVREDHETAQWGGRYSIYSVDSKPSSDCTPRHRFVDRAARANPVALELAATAVFFAAQGFQDPWDETSRRKPEKSATHLEEAQKLYAELSQFETPRALPNIPLVAHAS